MKIDQKDKKILDALQNNCRIRNTKLASMVGLSPTSTLMRVRRLKSKGMIVKYSAFLDPQKIGFEVMAIISIFLDDYSFESIENIKEKVLTLDEVIEAYHVSGEENIILKVAAISISNYSDFTLRKLMVIPGIRSFKSSFILSSLKNIKRFPIRPVVDMQEASYKKYDTKNITNSE
jgi:Lrp/AsnC family transcriptional regulator, leucine-responsive regulatory protein